MCGGEISSRVLSRGSNQRYGHELPHRMDRRDVEPGDRLLENQPRLQALLRGENGKPPQGDGPSELPQRVRIDAPAAHVGVALALEDAEADLRQLYERSFPCGCTPLVYQGRVQRDAPGALAPIPSAHKARRTHRRAQPESRV